MFKFRTVFKSLLKSLSEDIILKSSVYEIVLMCSGILGSIFKEIFPLLESQCKIVFLESLSYLNSA